MEESRKTQRPCLVISDNEQNETDKWIVMAPITTDDLEKIRPVEVYIKNTSENGLDEPSKIQINYPFTANKKLRLAEYLGIANNNCSKP